MTVLKLIRAAGIGLVVWIFVFATVLGCLQCETTEKLHSPESGAWTVKHVVKVVMHETNHFTLFERGRAGELIFRRVEAYNIRLIADVPEGSDMYAFQRVINGEVEIHITSPEIIIGGEWNHGKFGHGQTVVVR